MTDSEGVNAGWVALIGWGSDVWVGLVGDRVYVGSRCAPKRLIEVDYPVGLLPLLERPYNEVVREIQAREEQLGVAPGALLSRLPLMRIPCTAIDIRSDYWTELALGWFATLPLNDQAKAALNRLPSQRWASQRVQLRARRILQDAADGPPSHTAKRPSSG